jgi:hypothetical protein
MVQVPGPVPQDPPQFGGGLPVKGRVSRIDLEDELHAPILSPATKAPLHPSQGKDLEKMFAN